MLDLVVLVLDFSASVIRDVKNSLELSNLILQLLLSYLRHLNLGLELDSLNLFVRAFFSVSLGLLFLHIHSLFTVALFVDEHLNCVFYVMLEVRLELRKRDRTTSIKVNAIEDVSTLRSRDIADAHSLEHSIEFSCRDISLAIFVNSLEKLADRDILLD